MITILFITPSTLFEWMFKKHKIIFLNIFFLSIQSQFILSSAEFGTDTDIEHISCKSTTRTWTYIKYKKYYTYIESVYEEIEEKSMEMKIKKNCLSEI